MDETLTVKPEPGKQAEPNRFQRWLKNYRPEEGVYDELLDESGAIRPGWSRFLEQIDRIRPDDFSERWHQAQRVIRENGVTYNVYGDPQGTDRPWDLDPIPFVITQQDWQQLEKGLIQRARLMDAVLADLAGPQNLIRNGLLPQEMLFSNQRFLRPCHGLPASAGHFLHFYAVDLARAPDGRWWVVSDRVQAPSGTGYGLENRLVVSRMIPEVARECHLVRLARFFDRMRESLAAASPNAREQPHVVMYTPGPYNETYFEQAYLARYLGLTLASSEDLTTRDDRVFLKTLDGLQPVDVMWRRVDDEFSDPLELRSDSRLGVAGLLQAVRAGNVAVLNLPGSGVVENPAIMAFLPVLCRRLLNEDLHIPSVATWWCGQKPALKTAVDQIDRLVVKHAFEKGTIPVRFGGTMPAAERAALIRQVERDPFAYVAQESVTFSQAPVWSSQGFRPRRVSIRVFLVAHEDGYQVMPGGLTRVAGESQTAPGISMQQGSGSKDTWVLSEEPLPAYFSKYETRFPIVIRRRRVHYSSRSADNLYWIGRYAERSEFTTRLLRSVIIPLSSEGGFGSLTEVGPIWDLLCQLGLLLAPTWRKEPAAQGIAALENALKDAVFNEEMLGSLRRINGQLQRLAASSRDNLSLDTWRIVRSLGEDLKRPAPTGPISDMLPVLDNLITLHAALSGMARENTTRNPGWRFLDLGRRLERATYVTNLITLVLEEEEPARSTCLDAVLQVFDSSITYRQRYLFEPRLLPVLDTLLLDSANPRSLAAQIEELDAQLAALPVEKNRAFFTEGRKVTVRALAQLRTMDLGAREPDHEKQILYEIRLLLSGMKPQLAEVSSDLDRQYFSLLQLEQSTAETRVRPPKG